MKNNQHEQVLQLLITGGFLNPDKLQQARDIIKGCAPSPRDNHSLEEAAKQYATPHFPEMGGLYEKIKVAFLAGAAYVKGGEDYQAKYADALEWIVILAGPLRELVEIKKLKDATGKTPEYEERQPMAWHSAFQCIELLDKDAGYFKKLPYAELAAKIASSIPSHPSIDIVQQLRDANPYFNSGTDMVEAHENAGYSKCMSILQELLNQSK